MGYGRDGSPRDRRRRSRSHSPRDRKRDRSRSRSRRRDRSRSRSGRRRSRSPRERAADKPDDADMEEAVGEELPPGLGPKPDGKDKKALTAWELERARLSSWEKTGAVPPKQPLSHLNKFLGKAEEGASAAEEAAKVAKEAEKRQLEQQALQRRQLEEQMAKRQKDVAAAALEEKKMQADWQKAGPYVVENPAFEDHDSAEFECDVCMLSRPRGGFDNDQLAKLGDHPMRQGIEGPWRGKLVRVNPRGFGFIHCIEIDKQHGRDVFCQASLVERLAGGRLKAEDLARAGSCDIRCEFSCKMESDGKVATLDAAKLSLVCKKCIIENERKIQAKKAAAAAAAAGAAQARPKISPGMAAPLRPGFADPQKKLSKLLSGAMLP
eukprot:TRINITY_DN8854_c2_g2_i1.p1 TRINITY_DN8854_c2_g2~~TRINITY_DN8854_c2_g2_i1.p1  ORF type:complete len:380 (+),score=124.04 TRINITY_DN8854_c2_g2_i1:89-1228(+)